MNGDYFDLLLARMDGEIPTVEPRILPSTVSRIQASHAFVIEDTQVDTVQPDPPTAPPRFSPKHVLPSTGKLPSYQPLDAFESLEVHRVERTIEHHIVTEMGNENKVTNQNSPSDSANASAVFRPPLAQSPVRARSASPDSEGSSPTAQSSAYGRPGQPDHEWPSPAMPPRVSDQGVATVTPTIKIIREAISTPESTRESSPPRFAPPPISIRIDRIDVRSAPTKPDQDRGAQARTPTSGPRLTLDEYLKRRNGGGW